MRLFQHPEAKARLYLQAGSKKIYMEFYDDEGKRCQISTKTEDLETAKRKLEERLTIVRLTKSGELIIKKKKTILVETICQDVKKIVTADPSFKGKKETLRHLDIVISKLGKIDIEKLDSDDLRTVYNESLSLTKKSNFRKAFTLISKYATKKEYIKSPIEIPVITAKKPVERKVYGRGKIAQFLTFLQNTCGTSKNIKTRISGRICSLFCFFLAETGARYGEIIDIKYCDIKRKSESTEMELSILSSKTQKRRIIITPNQMELIELVNKHKRKFGVEIREEDYIFRGAEQSPIDFTNFIKEFKSRYFDELKELGVEEFTIYSLRHYFIQRKIDQGMALIDIAKHCGTSIKMIEEFYNKTNSVPTDRIYSGNDIETEYVSR